MISKPKPLSSWDNKGYNDYQLIKSVVEDMHETLSIAIEKVNELMYHVYNQE